MCVCIYVYIYIYIYIYIKYFHCNMFLSSKTVVLCQKTFFSWVLDLEIKDEALKVARNKLKHF